MLYMWRGTCTLVCWHVKTCLEPGSVTAYLTTTLVHSYKLLIICSLSLCDTELQVGKQQMLTCSVFEMTFCI